MARIPFFAVRYEPPPVRRTVLMILSFVLPLGIWSAFSYLPFLWHPLVELHIGGAPDFVPGDRLPKETWRVLVDEDADWQKSYRAQAARIVADDKELFDPGPGRDPIPAGRSLRRTNQKAVYSFAPPLIAMQRLSSEDERDVDLVAEALRTWSQEAFAGGAWKLSAENKERAKALLAGLTFADDGVSVPDDKVLPPASPQGVPANPVFLPAPHEVAIALVAAFTTEPLRDDSPWLHERLVHSLWVVAKGFGLALLVGLPLGILAGSFPALSRLIEPVTNFVGYIPPPAFAALLVAVFGLFDGPKVGIVFIASVFPMVAMIANTVRSLDRAIIEAAQTLGASRRSLVMRVLIPASLPRILEDIRVLLALGWTILIIAELTGEKSGLSAYMDTQSKYRHYENVFAVMIILGCLGLIVDRALAAIQPLLFPWIGKPAAPWLRQVWWLVSYLPRMATEEAESRQKAIEEQLRAEKGGRIQRADPPIADPEEEESRP